MQRRDKIILWIIILICAPQIIVAAWEVLGPAFRASHLDKKDLEWLNCYKHGSVITFVSDEGNEHTLTYYSKNVANNGRLFYYTDASNGTFTAHAHYTFFLKDNGSSPCFAVFSIIKPLDTDTLYNDFTSYWGSLSQNGIPQRTRDFSIDNVTYNNCLVIDSTQMGYNDTSERKLTEIVFSKDYGLIYYRMDDGEIFTRRRRQDAD